MPDSNSSSKGRRKLLLIIGLTVLVLGAVVAGVTMRWWVQSTGPASPRPLPEVVDEAQNKALGGDFDGAHKVINDELAKSDLSDQQKFELYAQQGNTYNNQGDKQKALDSYGAAVAVKPSMDLYFAMGEIAEALEDPQGAIEYYKQAIAAIPEDDPVGDADKQAIELRIKELEKQ